MKQAKNWNNVNVYVNEQNVFKCKLNELEFGGDGQLDPLVLEAEKLIQKAYWTFFFSHIIQIKDEMIFLNWVFMLYLKI